ncbi:piggyBac transposable element-derived protein 4-like [Procambarus clarkii]|uniref:piggyBac transposable element-derived protein 4-like n=1 Tax=Procambarus clarkii TaxID=6728 RepID=UPI003742779B
MLAESTTGYICGFDVYSGIGKTIHETVTGLIRPLVNKGHHLYMYNYYNSVSLTEKLRELGVYTCGTIRLIRGAPKELQNIAKGKLPVDTTVYLRKVNTFVLLWKDKRVVSIITNLHNADTQQVQRRKRVRRRDGTTALEQVTVNKPIAICDYNKFMKGVDHFDHMVKHYHFARKSHKWTKKITFYFLQMTLQNAFSLYKSSTSDRKKLTLLQFHEVAIWSLLKWDKEEWPATTTTYTHLVQAPDLNDDTGPAYAADKSTPGPSGVRRPLFTSTPQAEASTESEHEISGTMSLDELRQMTQNQVSNLH